MSAEQHRQDFELELAAAGFPIARCKNGDYVDVIMQRFWWLFARAIVKTEMLCITGFFENERPEFRQGTPTNELEELLTAEDVNGMIGMIDAKIRNAIRYERLTEKVAAGEWILLELTSRKEIVHGPEKAKVDAVLDAMDEPTTAAA